MDFGAGLIPSSAFCKARSINSITDLLADAPRSFANFLIFSSSFALNRNAEGTCSFRRWRVPLLVVGFLTALLNVAILTIVQFSVRPILLLLAGIRHLPIE
jgi:hypothetical protein